VRHTSFVNPAAFSPDGKKVVMGSQEKTVRIWDLSAMEKE
jgi:WD40 repeat protein